ncbi:hypothetical protein BD410DRAFT_844603 [Rickenella mellea]|uniref:Protein kinase domain-containing protein n=1 Tax=Rickenella mellea TaxID=50990 RepID=A0A4Y7PNY0_9AGAM|nr:hypothetical protein BD410DRAFT_844603 [Rickenella mellea]
MDVPSFYRTDSIITLHMDGGGRVNVKVVKVFTPFSRGQVSLVRVTENLRDLPPIFIIKTFDPRFDGIRFNRKGALVQPWSQQAKEEAEALCRRGTPKTMQFHWEYPEEDDLVGWEQLCYRRMVLDYSIEVEAYRRLQPFQGHHIPTLYGEAKLITTDVTRAIIPRTLLIEYIPNALPINKVNNELITPTLAKSFLALLKAFHARGVVHNDLNHGNILVGGSESGEARAVLIDFGQVCLRQSQTADAEWALLVRQQADTRCMLRQLKESLGTEDMTSFIGEPIDVYA